MKLGKGMIMALTAGSVALGGGPQRVKADPPNSISLLETWSSGGGRDAMTDKQWYGAQTVRIDKLAAYCHPPSNVLDVILTSESYLGDGFREVQYRIDQRSPVTVYTHYGKKKLDLPDRFVADAKGGKSILIRFSTYDYTMIDRKFSLDGFDQVVETLRTHCPPAKSSKPAPIAATKSRAPDAQPAMATNPCSRLLSPSTTSKDRVEAELLFRRCMMNEH